MTLNVVLRAKGEKALAPGGIAITCKDIANRWLATADWPQTGVDLAIKLTSAGGPLELIEPGNIDRIETNLQIAHAPKSAIRDFRTDYLLKVFRYNAEAREFQEALSWLLSNEAGSRELGRQGLAYVEREYRWPTVLERVESLIQEVSRRRSAAPA